MSTCRDAESAAGGVDERLAARARDEDRVRAPVGLAFMPGETIEDALRAAQEQQRDGINTILTRLGENITRVEEAEEVTQHYLDVLDKVAAAGLDAHISVKPTQLGLDQDPRAVPPQPRPASSSGPSSATTSSGSTWRARPTSIRRSTCSATAARSRRESASPIQAYLYRTEKDIESLIPLGGAIRIVKGAYLEPPDVAFPKKSDVDENFYKLCVRLLQPDAIAAGCLLHIATHDMALAERLSAWIQQQQRPGVGVRVRDALRHPARRSSCGWPGSSSACACSSATASTGSRGTCAASPNARPTSGSW